MIGTSKKTSNGKLVVDIIDYAEPNNGRELWKVNVLYHDKNINGKLFSYDWNYINFNAQKWQLDGFGYAYIPAEGTAKLIDLDTLYIHDLSFRALSTTSFIGNSFGFHKLLEVYYDAVEITDLETLQTKVFNYKNQEHVEWAAFLNANEIEITLVKRDVSGTSKRRTEVRGI